MLKYFGSQDKLIEEPRLVLKKNLSLNTHSFTHIHNAFNIPISEKL